MSQKNVKNKMVRPGDFKDKGAHLGDEVLQPAAHPTETPALQCVMECNVPNVGTWKAGEIITDPETISKVQGSPYFQPVATTQEGG